MEIEEAVEQVKTTIDIFTEWGDNIQSGVETLSSIRAVADIADRLNGFSIGMGLMGSFSSLLGIILGEQSEQQQILEAIAKVDAKIDALQVHMDAQFVRLEMKIVELAAQTQINPHMENLGLLKDRVKLYGQRLREYNGAQTESNKASLQDAIYRLTDPQKNNVDPEQEVRGLYNSATGRDQKTSIFEAYYNQSNGNLTAILNIGREVQALARFGLMADCLIKSLKRQSVIPANVEAEKIQAQADAIACAQNASSLMGHQIQEIYQNWADYLERCKREANDNIKNFVTSKLIPKIDANEKKKSAESMCATLSKEYFWFDFMVVIYNPVSTYNNHLQSGWENHGAFFRVDAINGKVNVGVAWIEKSRPALGKSLYNPISVTNNWAKAVLADTTPGKTAGLDYNRKHSPFFWVGWNPGVSERNGAYRSKGRGQQLYKDARRIQKNLVVPFPGYLFVCRRYNDVWMYASNVERVSWVVGEFWTIGIFL